MRSCRLRLARRNPLRTQREMRDVLTVRTTHYLNEMPDVPASRDRARTPQPAAHCSPCNQAIEMACSSEETRISSLFLTVYSSIFLQNRGLRNHRGGVAPGAVSPPGADGSTC